MNRPIALLTDFGLKDHYAGSLKGVILGINPKAVAFDVTHDIQPQNIRQGAFVLQAVYPVLPKGTTVVAVVDPGVGSERQAICVKTQKGYLVAPNNGILTTALEYERVYEVRKIENDRYFRKPVSSTFHGRDIFAPVAAWLSCKDIFSSLGPRMERIHRLHIPKTIASARSIKGEIVYLDHFGNAMTNISRSEVKKAARSGEVDIFLKGKKRIPLKPFFSAGGPDALIAVWNSADFLELAVKEDSARDKFGLKIGDPVIVRK